MATFKVCLNPDQEDEETGILKFMRRDSDDRKIPFQVFAPGKWFYFIKEVE